MGATERKKRKEWTRMLQLVRIAALVVETGEPGTCVYIFPSPPISIYCFLSGPYRGHCLVKSKKSPLGVVEW